MPLLRSAPHRMAALVRQPENPLDNRVWVYLSVAVFPPVAGYLVLAALFGMVTAIAPGATVSFAGVLAAAGPGWLAACHVPLDIAGHPLGVLPLLPAVLVMALAARAASFAAVRLRLTTPAQAWPVVGTIAVAHAVFGAGIALYCGSGPVRAVVALAFFICGALAAIAATLGLARRCGIVTAVLVHADDATRHGLRAGALGMTALAAGGILGYVIGLAMSFPTAAESFRQIAPGFGGGLGLWLLSVAYLPNALIGGLSFVTGPGVAVGTVQLSPFVFHGGAVPAMPLFAVLPERFAAWWPVFLLLPLAAGALVGWSVRRRVTDRITRIRAIGIAGLTAAISSLVLAAAASGSLGDRGFGPITVPAGLLALATFGWIALPAVAFILFGERWWRPQAESVNAVEGAPEPVAAEQDSTLEPAAMADEAIEQESAEDTHRVEPEPPEAPVAGDENAEELDVWIDVDPR